MRPIGLYLPVVHENYSSLLSAHKQYGFCVCQPGRGFQAVQHMALYYGGQIFQTATSCPEGPGTDGRYPAT